MLSEDLYRRLGRKYCRKISSPGYMEIRDKIIPTDSYKYAEVYGLIDSGMRDSSGFNFMGVANGQFLGETNTAEHKNAIHIKVGNHYRLL